MSVMNQQEREIEQLKSQIAEKKAVHHDARAMLYASYQTTLTKDSEVMRLDNNKM